MKGKKHYRVAVLGCGKIGALFESEPKREKPASHSGAVMANDRTELVAIVDINTKNLASAKKLFPSAKNYLSISECLKNERLDIVIIATPPTARLSIVKECVHFRVPIIVCEKPLAKSVREAEQIKKIVEKSNTIFVLNYQRRFSPLFARVRADIKKGKLGRIQQITCYYSNGLYSNGGHIIDSLSYLIDDEIVSVIGLKNLFNKTCPAGDINVDAILSTRKGTKISMQSFDQKEYGIHDIRIYGTKGSAVLTDYGITLVETPALPSRFVGIKQLNTLRQRSSHTQLSATKGALAHAIECHEKGRIPSSSVKSGLSTLRVLDAVSESAKYNGKRICTL